jgi:hypothetical protein
VVQLEEWFKQYADRGDVGRDGGDTTAQYAEGLADSSELVVVAGSRHGGREVEGAQGLATALAKEVHRMEQLLEAYCTQIDITGGAPRLQEMLLRRYSVGDTVKERHRDTHSLAMLRYWGQFGGGALEWETKAGAVRRVGVGDGDLVVMAGSQLRHGCGAISEGSRYVLVAFYDLPEAAGQPRKTSGACR